MRKPQRVELQTGLRPDLCRTLGEDTGRPDAHTAPRHRGERGPISAIRKALVDTNDIIIVWGSIPMAEAEPGRPVGWSFSVCDECFSPPCCPAAVQWFPQTRS